MLREATDREQLERIRDLYEASFPEAEKKPFSFMLQKREEGFFDILSIEDERGDFCGLVIMLLSAGLALTDYLAIVPERQGGGIGSRVLGELRERYGRDRIVVEIESTRGLEGYDAACEGAETGDSAEASGSAETAAGEKTAESAMANAADNITVNAVADFADGVADNVMANAEERLRRKAFYLRNGMVPMGFLVELMGVEMEILTFGRKVTFEEYFDIYGKALPWDIADKVKLIPGESLQAADRKKSR